MSWMCSLFFQRTMFAARLLVALFCLIFIYSASVLANDIVEFEVTEDEGVFYINASVVLDAPAEYIHNVLTDYVHIYRLNPSIIESEVLASPGDNVARIRTKVIACVISYCEEIERVEDVRILASGDIQAKIVPQFSQFKSGATLWQIRSMGEGSRLSYHAEMEPDFFIPPIIGNVIVKAKLRYEIMTSFRRLEKIASIQLERDWNPDWIITNWANPDKTKPGEQSGMDK
jgi:hypothetical protein